MTTTSKMILAAILASGLMACATAKPPGELTSARTSYKRAAQGPAADYNPADLDTAKKALARAEQAFAEDGNTQEVRDLAYRSDLSNKIAAATGAARMYEAQQGETLAKMHTAQTSEVRTTTAELSQAKRELAVQGQAIEGERARRQEAEERLARASENLAKFASVKLESRGTVITLAGSVLFASGESELFPIAEVRLDGVAEMLTQQDPDSTIVVEGHTDSQGRAAYNQTLSVKRAEAVRSYLVGRGIAPDRITAKGFGSERSIADNKSVEGRANNRRVEIVVSPPSSVSQAH